MAKVVPAIIPTSLDHLKESIAKLQGATKTFQVDIVDGDFVPFASWPYNEGAEINAISDAIAGLDIEYDLMIRSPEETLSTWLMTPATQFVIHVESTDDIARCIQTLKDAGKKVGLSLNNDTELSRLDPFIEDINYIQCMGIAEIGKQGNSFDDRVLERVKVIKEKHPNMEVSVDGSVNMFTICLLKEVGVDRFVSGSAIFGTDDPVEACNTLEKMASGDTCSSE